MPVATLKYLTWNKKSSINSLPENIVLNQVASVLVSVAVLAARIQCTFQTINVQSKWYQYFPLPAPIAPTQLHLHASLSLIVHFQYQIIWKLIDAFIVLRTYLYSFYNYYHDYELCASALEWNVIDEDKAMTILICKMF